MPKDFLYTELICKRFCSFYKGGKEELQCQTYRYLRKNVPKNLLQDLPEDLTPDFSLDGWIREEICSHCDFIIDGCDYRDGNPSPPCGGYVVVEFLKKKGLI